MLRPLACGALLFTMALAGCITQSSGPSPLPSGAEVPALGILTFAPVVTVDAARIASEPSIKVAKDGTIFIAAPTGVVKYATRPLDAVNQLDKGIFQGAIWRSTDHGATFQFKAGLGSGPLPYHTLQPGGGDSDIAIDSAGTIYVSDQFGLATEAVQWSKDNGETWSGTKSDAGGQPTVDREWLWPDPARPGTLYMNFEHNGGDGAGVVVSKTTDGGETWTQTFASNVDTDPGPIVAWGDRVAFSLISGKDIHYVHSEDAGQTWKTDVVLKDREFTTSFPQTVVDRAGNVYVAWTGNHGNVTHIMYLSSTDNGATWSPPRLAYEQPGLALFLWAAAGDEGRLGFSWYEAPDPAKEWYEHAATVVGAATNQSQVVHARVSDVPARVGEPCQGGVSCTSGRELGDFQQCAITPTGDLVVTYVTVISAQDGGRITFGQMATGPKLIVAAPDPWVV